MSEGFKVEPTDVLYEPDLTKRQAPWLPKPDCRHCGQGIGFHWKHEDGRITCTRPVQPQNEKP